MVKRLIKVLWGIFWILLGLLVVGGFGSMFTDTEPNKPVTTEVMPTPEPKETEEPKDTATRDMIWEFMLDKGFEVETVLGVPQIYETENGEGWHVLTTDGKEYAVVLFNGEVSAITPMN